MPMLPTTTRHKVLTGFIVWMLVVLTPAASIGTPTELKIGVYQNYPLSFSDKNGQVKGLFIDIIEHIARQHNWRIEYDVDTWTECLKKLHSGQIDLLGVIAFSDTRLKRYDFSYEAVVTDWGQIYTGTAASINSVLDLEGKKIAVLKEDIYYEALKKLVKQFGIQCRFIEAFEYEDVLLLVQRGVCDAGLVNQIYGRQVDSFFAVKKTAIIFSPQKLYFAAPKGRHQPILNTIDSRLRQLKTDKASFYYKAVDQWLSTQPATQLPHWLKPVLTGGLLLLAFSLIAIVTFRAQVRSKTKELSAKNEALLNEIDTRKQAERALQLSEERYRTIAKFIFDFTYALRVIPTGDCEVVWAAGKIQTITGYTPKELQARGGWSSIIYSDDHSIVADQMAALLRGDSKSAEYRIMTKYGERRWVRDYSCVIWDSQLNAATHIYGAVQDITEQKRAEQAIRDQNVYMTTLHDITLGLIRRLDLEDLLKAIIDRAGNLMDTQDAFIYLHDAQADELVIRVGTGFYDDLIGYRIKPGDGLAGKVWQSGQPITVENYSQWHGRLPDAIFSNLQSAIGIPLAFENRIIGVIGMNYFGRKKEFDDNHVAILRQLAELASMAIDNAQLYTSLQQELKDRRQAQEENVRLQNQLLHSQKMEAIGTLAGGVAHDFNNILQTIAGYTQLLMLGRDSNDTHLRKLAEIDSATQKAGALTRQLLTFSRRVETQFIPLNINFQIKQTVEILKRTLPKMIEIELDLSPELNKIKADVNQFDQVLMNISINAHHAMPDGGHLRFQTCHAILDDTFCESHLGAKPGAYVLLVIADDGAGMDERTVARIFEPFFTTKAEGHGTGLGLAIVYGIVKAHDGYIICESSPGAGTTFKIYFPVLSEDDLVEIHRHQKAGAVPTGKETILVVDDDKAVLNLVKSMLVQHGYHPLTVTSGEQAIRTFKSKHDQIALVLLDLNMPGMGGEFCFNELVAMDPNVRIIVASGFNPSAEFQAKLDANAAVFVEKPFDIREMLFQIRHMIDDRPRQ